MMELLWTPEAIQDREDIYDYIEADNPTATLALDELLSEKASQLAEHPNLGRLGRVADTRELVAHQNYVLVCDVIRVPVRVLRVLHATQQRPPNRIC
ncbi:type II toxin-antitoxin system RelE/ParE family toxin [Idiomarina sp. PL1-037]|uniref:type II toxin-antitoxin system RelE/ParE family toxin n=1 Tax=Idiomarina sp. PL1-037 TaxID=3095365 RepID=UPI002ACC1552|nr:type II toxin-antitoxin system RelE/ParE family toxin [Idiomarina sp. PL1-037]WQC53539.1 type II toxin-antitoxin system RelE/ParE family toxin [Idiomarina sp. PL1-037]